MSLPNTKCVSKIFQLNWSGFHRSFSVMNEQCALWLMVTSVETVQFGCLWFGSLCDGFLLWRKLFNLKIIEDSWINLALFWFSLIKQGIFLNIKIFKSRESHLQTNITLGCNGMRKTKQNLIKYLSPKCDSKSCQRYCAAC